MKKKFIFVTALVLSVGFLVIASCNKIKDKEITEVQKPKMSLISGDELELTKIGYMDSTSGNVLTANTDSLAAYWEGFLSESLSVTTTLTTFTIVSKVDDRSVPYYLLLGSDGTHTVGTEILLVGTDFFFQQPSEKVPFKTVTCTGCATGCFIAKTGGTIYCDSGNCGNGCSKSETITINRVQLN